MYINLHIIPDTNILIQCFIIKIITTKLFINIYYQ